MDKENVLALFKSLARSQGVYGRLLEQIGLDGEYASDGFFEQFADCRSAADVVIRLECGL